MNDTMEPLVQFSPCKGKLTYLTVPGKSEKQTEYENDVSAEDGMNRTAYCYAPFSGCPDAKQTQILFILRDDASEASAQEVLTRLKICELAEQEHFLVILPNPREYGWNYDLNPSLENDMDFLIRCFAMLKGSALAVNGFNGLLFYVAVSAAASAMMASMCSLRPANVSAMLTTALPEDYRLPANAFGIETAAWCAPGILGEYLAESNGCAYTFDQILYGRNPECRLCISDRTLDAALFYEAWDTLFSRTRRWQNDTYGTYQPRTMFTQRGFIPHIQEECMGVNNHYPHTWFTYIPPKLRGNDKKVPLVFYFHGVNCVPLYGAEQSNWHNIAEREDFIVVYPAPAVKKCWNIYDLPNLPSDMEFILALIKQVQTEHPIDTTRIYATGFSMGGMMTHAITAAYPEIFAAGAPCNAFAKNRFEKPCDVLTGFLKMSEKELGEISYSRNKADEKKQKNSTYRMPIFQNAGMDDKDIGIWPIKGDVSDEREKTIAFWKSYNAASSAAMFDETTPTGLAADVTEYLDEEERFIHQIWYSEGFCVPLFEFVAAKRMPHAIVPQQMEWAWKFISKFARREDGTLIVRTSQEEK